MSKDGLYKSKLNISKWTQRVNESFIYMMEHCRNWPAVTFEPKNNNKKDTVMVIGGYLHRGDNISRCRIFNYLGMQS